MLQKAEMPLDSSNFCWTLSHLNIDTEEPVMIASDSSTGTVSLATVDGGLTTLITRWNQMYTVLRFWWGNRLYRCTYCSLDQISSCVSRVPCQVEPKCKDASADPVHCTAQSALDDICICPGQYAHVLGDHVADAMHASSQAYK